MDNALTVNVNQPESGYTVLEIMLATAIIGFMVGIATVMFDSQRTFVQTEGLAKIDFHVAKALHDIYEAPPFTGLTTTKALQLNAIPVEMVWVTANIPAFIDAYKGSVTIAPSSSGTGTDNGIMFNHPLVPRGECAIIVAELSNYFDEVYVGAVIVKVAAQGLDQAALATECDKAGSTKVIKAVYVP